VLLAGGSAAQIVSGLAFAKVLAQVGGPTAVGLQGIYLSVMTLTVLVCGFSVGQAMISGARGTELTDVTVRLAQLGGVVLWWYRLAATVVIGVAVTTAVVLRATGHAGPVAWQEVLLIGCAVSALLVQSGELAVLTAAQRAGAVAVALAAGSLLGSASACATVLLIEDSVALAVAQLALAQAAAATLVRRRSRALGTMARGNRGRLPALLREGLPLTLSVALGSGVQASVPLLVQALGSTFDAGLYRAASAITVSYVGVIVVGLARDYFPRVASAAPGSVSSVVSEQQRLLLAVAHPMVMIGIVVAAPVLRLAYSPAFDQAEVLFALQMLGDLFRLAAFCFAYLVMARLGGRSYLALEAAAGAALLLFSVLGMHLGGLNGLGLGYCFAYALYLVLAAGVCHVRLGLRFDASITRAFALSCLAAFSLVALVGSRPQQVVIAFLALIPSFVAASSAIRRHRARRRAPLVPLEES